MSQYMNQRPGGYGGPGYGQPPPPHSQPGMMPPNSYYGGGYQQSQPGPPAPVSAPPPPTGPPSGAGPPSTGKPGTAPGAYGDRPNYPQQPQGYGGRPAMNGPSSSQQGPPGPGQYGNLPNSTAAQPTGPPPMGPGAGYGPQGMQQNRAPAAPPGMYQPGTAPPTGPNTGPLTNQMTGMNISGMPSEQQRMQGPGMRQQGPPNSMAGPPYSGAPPTSMGMAPPGNMSGPSNMSGPPPNMSGPPPAGMSGPPPSTPPSSMPGPPTSMGGGYQQMRYSAPPGGPSMGGPTPTGMGPPAYPGGPPVPLSQMGGQPGPGMTGARQPYPGSGGQTAPGMNQGPGMQQPQQPGPRRLNPDQMPSAIQVIEDDRRNRGKQQFVTNLRGQVPPLISTDFDVVDQGNCSPRFMRATVYNIPCTQDIIKQSHVPIGLVVSPFAELKSTEVPPPIVDHGPNGPVRCNRCKAYMCPYMQFVDGGRRFQCAFCGGLTEVPPEYFQPLDHMGRRVDSYDRAELSLGAYEYLATTDYCKNSKLPGVPAFVFMIDVTYQSVKTGMVHLLCKEMSRLLDLLPREHGMKESAIRVGFVTYDSTLHFYNLNSALAQPQMLVVSDVSDVFMPLLDGFLVKLSESRAVIESLLEQIPQMFAETRETESMLGPVVQAGLEALKAADCSGKLYVFHASLPIADAPGKLKNRDDRKLLGTDKEKTLLAPQVNFYTKLGNDCVAAGCSVDLFLFPNSYMDLATIGQVSTLTGGQVYKYNYFQAASDGERFIHDLTHNIKRPVGFDAVMRVRTSTGIRPTDFYGTFFMANTTDVELASIDSDKAVTVEIKHDDKLAEDAGAFVQAAVLYTSISGQRRLRVLNLSFNCCSQMADMYRNCETDSIINFLAKQAVKGVFNSNPKAIRDNLITRCATILACYRRNCAAPSSQGQLILPECMKLLPLYTNCILKSDALSGSTDITTDDRSWLMDTVLSMGVAESHAYFYPKLLPLLEIPDDADGDLPVAIRCTADKLKENEVYLLENGLMMFLWIGLHVSNDWVQNVFGVNSAAQIDIDAGKLLSLDNPTSVKVRGLIQRMRHGRPRYMKLALVRQRDTLEAWFRHFLVEDKGSNASASYVDFLCHMHKEIRNLLS